LAENYSGGPLSGTGITNVYDQFLRRTNLSSVGLTNSYLYDSASRLHSVSEGTNSATYAYLANSPLVSQISFTNGSVQRMVTTKAYDLLNRLTNITSVPSASSAVSFAYQYNSANQRTRRADADSSYWTYSYDSLGQVISGKRYWSDNSPVAGQQFEYSFDDIGDRASTRSGGDQYNGSYLRSANYGNNSLNQITSRDVPGYLDIFGSAKTNATVSLWTPDGYWAQTSRHLDFYRGEIALNNTTGALWLTITNLAVLPNGTNADIATNFTGSAFVPKATESFTYDSDGNLTSDGRWTNRWDAENRLIWIESLTNDPAASKLRLTFGYDTQSRRTTKQVENWSGSAWTTTLSNKFVYDSWNLIAELNGTNNAAIRAYTWGLDLSGSLQGAGGIGGLIEVNDSAQGAHFSAFDGNGNVSALTKATDGAISANYEYGPFGDVLRATGPASSANALRFSSKYRDPETAFLYYGYRSYNPSTGRWLNRDPQEERGGNNLYACVRNRLPVLIDFLGLEDRSGGELVWTKDVIFQGHKIGTAQVWIHTSYLDAPDAVWVQFNKEPGSPKCRWTQFMVRNIYDPEGQPMDDGYYNYTLTGWRRFGDRYVEVYMRDSRWWLNPYWETQEYYGIGDQPDAKDFLTANRPKVTADADDFLICQDQPECGGSEDYKWAPAFRVSWRQTQLYTSRRNPAYEVTRGESITTLPNWASAPKWLAGFSTRTGQEPWFVDNPTK